MSKFEKEYLLNNIEMNIDKAEHIAERIIQDYDLEKEDIDSTDDAILAYNRHSIWIDMRIMTDYIKSIRDSYNSIRKAVMA